MGAPLTPAGVLPAMAMAAGPLKPLAAPALPSGADAGRIWKSAQDFEAMAIGELLQPMFATVDLSETPFGGGDGEQAWMPMLVNEFAKEIERAGGLGLARPVYEQMLRTQEAAQGGKGSRDDRD